MRQGVPHGPIWVPLWHRLTAMVGAIQTACATALVLWLSLASLAQAASIQVIVSGVTSAPGRVFVSLCANGFGERNCTVGQSAPASSGTIRFSFSDLEPGIYALAAFQDLNGNGVLDKTQNGLPLEPYGFSNGAGRSAAPRFEQAAVRVSPGTVISVRLTSIAARH